MKKARRENSQPDRGAGHGPASVLSLTGKLPLTTLFVILYDIIADYKPPIRHRICRVIYITFVVCEYGFDGGCWGESSDVTRGMGSEVQRLSFVCFTSEVSCPYPPWNIQNLGAVPSYLASHKVFGCLSAKIWVFRRQAIRILYESPSRGL